MDELLDLPPADRAARLQAMAAEGVADTEVLGRLLAHHEAAERDAFLDTHLKPVAHLLPEQGELGARRFGSWQVLTLLGEGGMGSVWRARRDDGRFEGEAAIKLMHGRLHGGTALRRFEREGRILGRLTHPNIARLLDAGVADTGQPYLVLELVLGEPIDRWCDTRRLPVEARLALFADVAEAVAAAHAQLVVHRDLKPGNVMVNSQGQVKLLDFGIARLLDDSEDPDAAALTRTGQRAFTPAWAAPEQMRGEPLSTRTDVWALGVLLCQLLTGRHPSGLPWNSDLNAWMRFTLQPNAKRPSQLAQDGDDASTQAAARGLSPARLARRLQGELDQIVLRALAEEPERRYASAKALAEDVQRHLRNEPVTAVSETLAYRSIKFIRRNRLVVGATSAAFVVLLAGVMGTTWQALEARAQRDAAQAARAEAEAQATRAERERAQALRQLDRAEAMNELMIYALGPVSRESLSVVDVLERGATMVDKQFADAPELKAFLNMRLANLWSHGGNLDRSAALYQSARMAAQQGADTVTLTNIDCRMTRRTGDAGNFDQAISELDRLIANIPRGDPRWVDTLSVCLKRRAQTSQEKGLFANALADLDAALKLYPSPRRGEVGTVLDLQVSRAHLLGITGQFGPSVKAYDELLDALKRRGVLDSTAHSTTLNNFYVVLSRAGQLARALEIIDQAVLSGYGSGASRGSDRIAVSNRAHLLVSLGRLDEALPVLDEGVESALKTGASRDIGFRAFLHAEALCAAGRLAQCKGRLDLSTLHLSKILANTNPALGRLQVLRARWAWMSGELPLAREELARGMAVFDAARQPEAWRVEGHLLRAQIELLEGQRDAALVSAQAAVSVAKDIFKDFPHSHRLGKAYHELGRVHLARGEKAPARAALIQALEQYEVALGAGNALSRQVQAQLTALR